MVLTYFLTSTAGLPQDLWDPLTPQRAAATAPSGGVSLAIAIAGFVLVALLGFLLGEWRPRRQSEGCRIVLSKSGDESEFLVLAGRKVIGRSDAFPADDDEAARAAHDALIARLRADEMEPEPWYDPRLATPA
jgi:hypothetical protein